MALLNYANLRHRAMDTHISRVRVAFLERASDESRVVKESEAQLTRDLRAIDCMETLASIRTPPGGLALLDDRELPLTQNGRVLIDARQRNVW